MLTPLTCLALQPGCVCTGLQPAGSGLDRARHVPQAAPRFQDSGCTPSTRGLNPTSCCLQGLPCETYIAAFDRMQSIVFVNAVGNEVAIWKELTGGQLSDKFFEGAPLQNPACETCWTSLADLRAWGLGVSDRAVPSHAHKVNHRSS